MCRHLSNNIEPSVFGNDAPYVKLLSTLAIFGHAHLDSRTDSQALWAEYCIVGIPHNTAISLYLEGLQQAEWPCMSLKIIENGAIQEPCDITTY